MRAIAIPMRMLVKLPGPVPTTMPSIEAGSSTSPSTACSRSPALAARARRSGVRAQTAPKDVEVSKAKIVGTVDAHLPMGFVDVGERNLRTRRRKPPAPVLGPFDERDRPVEVRLEICPLLGIDRGDAVEVEVRDGYGGVVAVADREGRAGDGLAHPERPRGAADERRLAGAQLAGD